jgi:hypothetical protein
MNTPIVTEIPIALQPVTRDDFADPPASERRLEPATQRDLVILSLLRSPGSLSA